MKLTLRDNIHHINNILQVYSPGSLIILSLIFFSGLLEGLSMISMLPFLEFFMKGNSLDSQSEISQKILNFFKNRDISLNFEIILIFFFFNSNIKNLFSIYCQTKNFKKNYNNWRKYQSKNL